MTVKMLLMESGKISDLRATQSFGGWRG